MRIAFFSTMIGSLWGGSEELWCRTANVLLERGHDVAFNCLRWPRVAEPLQQLVKNGAKAHFRSRRRVGRSLSRVLEHLPFSHLKFQPWLRKCRPDFVVISLSSHTDDPQIALTCQAAGIPYALLLQAAGSHKWVENRFLETHRAAYQHAQQCYFVSHENREIIESNLTVELPHACVVDNPLTLRADANPSWPARGSHWKLACVARVSYATKSQDLLLRVLRAPKWRTRPLQVSVWGQDDGNLADFRRALDLYGLHQQLSYGGISSNIEELWSQYHGLLLPSRAEGNALSLIEAMMCGRVPITTKVGRATELVDDNQSGFLAPAATAELLDEVLERAWSRREDWRAMGQQAAQTIRSRHSLRPTEDFADKILAVAMNTRRDKRHAA